MAVRTNVYSMTILLIGFASMVLFLNEIDLALALKCYSCKATTMAGKCDEESRGELKACIRKDDMCYKMVVTKRMEDAKDDEPHVGESRQKGCAPYYRKNHTLGCNFLSSYVDVCYCDTDRCNTHEYTPSQ